MIKNVKKNFIVLGALIVSVVSFIYIITPLFLTVSYAVPSNTTTSATTTISVDGATTTVTIPVEPILKKFVATHVQTPPYVKSIYMTSWVSGTRDWRKRMIEMIEDTELNAIIIDIKDDTGRISFTVEDEYLKEVGSTEIRIKDIREFIAWIHEKDIYVIGRISVFQDPYFVSHRPDLAVKRESDGEVWTDHKGIAWLDAGSKDVWDYTIAIAKESYNNGFDELNFDYIRFPSDGDMQDISYPFSNEIINADPNFGKAEVMREFYEYLYEEMKDTGAVISADLFGMTTTNKDDLNIGQVLEYAAPYFDYIAPMVYPSHYPPNFNGYSNPNYYPYEIVKYSMDIAAARLVELASTTYATTVTSGHDHIGPQQLRPWLQDFDYGGNYGEKEVREQKQAVYDAGLTSWMLWDPNNRYTKEALDKK